MKKIIAIIVIVCSISIGAFVWYMSNDVDTRDIYYDTVATYREITYKTISDETLEFDILMPTKEVYDQIPVIFYVHGGAFISGDKTDLTEGVRKYVVEDILDEGYAIISLNYRLLDEDTHFPANLSDVNDAVKYTTSIAEAYNFDVDNYGIWGVEAGAYLALTIAYSENGFFGGDSTLNEFSADIKYVIDFSGITNISSIRDITGMNPDELELSQADLDVLYGPGLDIYNLSEADQSFINRFDPLTYISDDTIATYIIHGLNDELVDIQQAQLLRDKLNEFEITYSYREEIGGDSSLSGLPDTEREIIVAEFVYFVKQNYIEN